ncbi:MAG: hypothetical protein AVO33_02365 [delta proteobacterium ML8_F1]|nr:MAG: hypothetical protein AVO33_02365 [delta proteobacterium ML8_F1]
MKQLKRAIVIISILCLFTLAVLIENMNFARDQFASIETHYLKERAKTLERTDELYAQYLKDGEILMDWMDSKGLTDALKTLATGEGGTDPQEVAAGIAAQLTATYTALEFDEIFYRNPEGRIFDLLGHEHPSVDKHLVGEKSSEGVVGGGYAFLHTLAIDQAPMGELVLWVSMEDILRRLEGYSGHRILYVQGPDTAIPFDLIYGIEPQENQRINAMIVEALKTGRIDAYELNVHQLRDTTIFTRIIPVKGEESPAGGYLVFHENDPVFHYGITVGYRNSLLLYLLQGVLVISLVGSVFVYRQTDKIIYEDKLTKLFTRGYFKRFGKHEIETDSENAVIILDVDNLKKINEKFGLNEGDRVLEIVGGIIKDSIRPTDIPIRWSGEEFIIVMPGTSSEHGRTIAELIRIGIEEYPFETFDITASVGVYVYETYEDILEFLNRVDENILMTKSSIDKKTKELSR